jgi:hypothetical protein
MPIKGCVGHTARFTKPQLLKPLQLTMALQLAAACSVDAARVMSSPLWSTSAAAL